MDDWQPGDLALCVQNSVVGLHNGGRCLRKGAFYTVASVAVCPTWGILTLVLREFPDHPSETGGFAHWRFIKVTPEEPDAEDEETLHLLNSTPAPVGV